MSIWKTLGQDAVNLLTADKTQVEAFVTPVLDNLAAGAVTEATKLANDIPNALVKQVVLGLISEYGPQLPTLISKYEGTAYDALVAFLQAEVNKLPN